jgi:PAS domain S-box-containing protein
MVLYFNTIYSIGFQFTFFLYVMVVCVTILTAGGIARVFLLINAYRIRERIFLESIGDGVCGIDMDGRVILWNSAAEIISGYSKKDMLNAPLTGIFSLRGGRKKTSGDTVHTYVLALSHSALLPSTTSLTTKDGRTLPLGATSAPVIDRQGTVRGAIIVFRDTTKEQQISRAKDEFVSLVSHQLRTPLTNMNWRLEMLIDGEAGKLTDEQKKYLAEIERGTDRMTDLVNLFLNVSRIHLGTLAITLSPCNIHTLIALAWEEYAPVATRKEIILKKKFDKTIQHMNCDPKIFHVILQNIISNAVAYTPPKGTITIQTKKERAAVIISVADTGIGIPKKDQPKIFTKLFRAENVRESHPDGNGLGLYVTQSLIQESGGTIWFESQEGKGTTFFISYPHTGMHGKQGTRSITP